MSYKFHYILLFGAGRSGTTALQTLLNSDPSVLIRGENNNFFYETFRSYRSLKKSNNSEQRSHPWYGFENFNADKYLETIQNLAHTFLSGEESNESTKVIGFKEIRLFNLFNSQGPGSLKQSLILDGRTPEQELQDYIQYIIKLFPRVKIIFLERDPEEIASSGWWKKRNLYEPKTLINDLNSFHESFKTIIKSTEGIHINHAVLRSKNLAEIQNHLYGPLDLPFQESRSSAALAKELTHSKWPHLTIQ